MYWQKTAVHPQLQYQSGLLDPFKAKGIFADKITMCKQLMLQKLAVMDRLKTDTSRRL